MFKTLDIPFIPSRGFECGQACVAMMVKYFYPDFQPNFEEFNHLIHHTPGKYTFPLQNAILLDHYGIQAKCFSSDDYKTTQEEPDIFKRWYGPAYEHEIKFVDINSYNWMVTEGKKRNLYELRVTRFDEILDLFIQGYLVSIPIDWNILSEKSGPFEGHFEIISGIDGDNILIHDPDFGPYQSYPKSLLVTAYSHPIIAHDLFVAYGKK